MSSYYNNLFRLDPFNFINTYTVDIKGWFEGLMRTPQDPGHQYYAAADEMKFCRLNFDPSEGLLGFGVQTVTAKFVGGTGIDGYWVPYKPGTGLPGYADVKRRNPPTPFVFTGGMNGCAFFVTDSPLGATYMRVYHHQHPGSDAITRRILDVGQPIISIHSFDDYGGAELPYGVNPVAFNFMYYRNSTWNYVSQPQEFAAQSQRPARRQIGCASIRSVF
jgi:hypothetical protein